MRSVRDRSTIAPLLAARAGTMETGQLFSPPARVRTVRDRIVRDRSNPLPAIRIRAPYKCGQPGQHQHPARSADARDRSIISTPLAVRTVRVRSTVSNSARGALVLDDQTHNDLPRVHMQLTWLLTKIMVIIDRRCSLLDLLLTFLAGPMSCRCCADPKNLATARPVSRGRSPFCSLS
jgi:hypothetical protein